LALGRQTVRRQELIGALRPSKHFCSLPAARSERTAENVVAQQTIHLASHLLGLVWVERKDSIAAHLYQSGSQRAGHRTTARHGF
jgi:hypothetical protein